jgi:hypothetical protein
MTAGFSPTAAFARNTAGGVLHPSRESVSFSKQRRGLQRGGG